MLQVYKSITHSLSVYCIVSSSPQVLSPSITTNLTPVTISSSPTLLFPSGNHHTLVCAYVLVCLLLSVLCPTWEQNHVVLVLFCLTYFTQHDTLKIHPHCPNSSTSSFLMAEYHSFIYMYHYFFTGSSQRWFLNPKILTLFI